MSLVYSSGIMFGFSGAGKLFTINLATGAATPSGTYSPVLTGATAYISSAILTISSSHNGNFAAGRQGATFTVVVSNVSANASIGNVTVTENLPNGLSLVSMSGAGWICTANTCTRNDPLAGGGSYAAINVIVNVSTNAASPQVNSVTVSGGGSGTATATDSVTITGSGASLSAVKSHAGTFSRGQQGAAYAVTVSNAQGSGATTGAVTVSEIVPTGLTLVSMSGAGWNCPSGGSSCTRSDALSGGGSYPAIAVTVNVAASAPGQVINQVQVTGGGSNPASAADTTAIGAGQTIAFGPLSSVIYGAAPFAAKATASSGLPVLLTSTTPAVCVAAGDLVTILNAGTCSIRATQAGNAVFGAAAPVVRSFGVNQARAGGQLTQAPGSPISVGKGPQSIAAGDFNGDGIQDLAIANNQDGTVTVLLGNGSGGFSQAPGSPVAAGPLPTSVAVGDFNGDGIPDLAVADNYRGNILEVSILLGNGQGRFTAAPLIQYFASGPPGALAVGDFNRDGFPDLALVNELGNNVTILLGDGSGGFAQAAGSPFAVGGQPTALVAADFNSDGVLDLAVTNGNDNTATVLLGTGTGAFTPAAGSPYSTGAFPFSIALADLNADGVPDLAIAANNGLTIMIGNGSGGFTASTSKTSVGINPIYVAVGDFNGDGKQDLAVVALVTIGPSEYANVLLLPGNGSGGISLTPLSSLTLYQAGNGSAVFGLGVGDFNGDGIEDVSVASYATNNVDILLGTTLTSQSIAFGPLSNVTLPAAAITLSAIASSGLPVLFASTTPSVCTVSGNVLTIVAAGTCSVQATQAGNASYSAATPVNQSFQVTASAQAAFFSGQVSLSNGVYFLQFSNGKAFGYYTYLTSSIIYHYDMGYEAFVPAASGSDAYLYDFATGHWFYTSQAFFPYLYDFTLKTWIYYFPNTTSPGYYTTGPRYFSNLTTGQIFTM
jgi:uncharacterized repeat protein (TIGR01451 family)